MEWMTPIVESEKAEAKGVGNSTTLSKDVSTKKTRRKSYFL